MSDTASRSRRLLALLLLVGGTAHAGPAALTPTGDGAVSSVDPDMPFQNEVIGGVGGPSGPVELHSYVRYALPAFETGSRVSSALLTGEIRVDPLDLGDEDYLLRLTADDDWNELTLTYNNAPGSTTTLAMIDPTGLSGGDSLSFDVTSSVDAEYAGDGEVSFHLKPVNSSAATNNLLEFYAKEAGPPFRLDVMTVPPGPGRVVRWANSFASASNVVSPASCLGIPDADDCALGPAGGAASIELSQFDVASQVSEIDLRGVDFVALERNGAGDLDFETSSWHFSDRQQSVVLHHTKGGAASAAIAPGNLSAGAYTTQFGVDCGAADAICTLLLFSLPALDTRSPAFTATVSAAGGDGSSPEILGAGAVGAIGAPSSSAPFAALLPVLIAATAIWRLRRRSALHRP